MERRSARLAVTLDNFGKCDHTIQGPVLAKYADADATFRIEEAQDIAPTSEAGALNGNGLRTHARHIGALFLLRSNGRLHVLRIGQRHDHLRVPTSDPSASPEHSGNRPSSSSVRHRQSSSFENLRAPEQLAGVGISRLQNGTSDSANSCDNDTENGERAKSGRKRLPHAG